jgi:hypothetical protein
VRWVVAGGLVAGIALALAVAVLDDDRGPATPAFIEAYERSRTGTYAIVEIFERRLVDGRTFNTEITTAQRPPNRLVTSGTTIEGEVDGERVACARAGDTEEGDLGCRRAPVTQSFAARVREEVDLLRALVTGRLAAYAVRWADGGCFEMRLRARILNPPYGEDATLCFDAATGAPRSTLIHRTQSTDTRTTVDLRADVTDADFTTES